MADYKFVELIFEPESINSIKFKIAQNSLLRNPRQLFALLVEKEISTNFLSRLKTRDQHLAKLFDKFSSPSPSEFQWKARILEESLQAFIFSLLANDFTDVASQESVAGIIVSVVKLSNPEGWRLLGVKLGEAPGILKRLIAGRYLRTLSRDRPTFTKSITSNPITLQTWAEIITDLMQGCASDAHNGVSRIITTREEMETFISSFQPCGNCSASFTNNNTHAESQVLRVRNDNHLIFDLKLRTFDTLLGCHLGPWKIILSAQALQDLKESVSSGKYLSLATCSTPVPDCLT